MRYFIYISFLKNNIYILLLHLYTLTIRSYDIPTGIMAANHSSPRADHVSTPCNIAVTFS